MSEYVTAIDFGTSKIALAAGFYRDDGLFVKYYDSNPVTGIRSGEILNGSQVEKVLRPMIEKASAALGEPITEAVVSISGREISSRDVTSCDETGDQNRIISKTDITRLIAGEWKGSENETVFEVAPQKYNVDDDSMGLFEEDVEGMRGAKLEGSFKVFCGKEQLCLRRAQVLSQCGLSVRRAILSPIASARAVLSSQEMENGVAIVDIGKGMTEVAIIKDRTVRDLRFIPFGGESITNDIRTVTNISIKRAEELKVRYGCCLEEMTPESKTLELIDENGETESSVPMQLLSRIIEARMSEIFDAVRYILNNSRYADKLPSGVVITGGTAYLGYILPLAKAMLERKCRLDAPRFSLTSDSAEGAFDTYASTAVGLLAEYFDSRLSTAGRVSIKAEVRPQDSPVRPLTIFEDQPPVEKPKEVSKPEKAWPGSGKVNSSIKKINNFFGDLFSDNGNSDQA